jgi:hypothetical protein
MASGIHACRGAAILDGAEWFASRGVRGFICRGRRSSSLLQRTTELAQCVLHARPLRVAAQLATSIGSDKNRRAGRGGISPPANIGCYDFEVRENEELLPNLEVELKLFRVLLREDAN